MLDFCLTTLQSKASQPLGLFFALVLGAVSAAASTCCTLPALGILVGYSGSRKENGHRSVIEAVIFFTLGIILSLMIIGGIAGFVGQTAQTHLGGYWKMFAGVVAIVLGLTTLKMLPFDLTAMSPWELPTKSKTLGTAAAGLIMGGGVAVSSLPCNPGIFIILGAAVLQGKVIWATLLLAMFAFGFSLPLGAVLLGLSLGKALFLTQKANTAIRWVSGGTLFVAGFYLLLTF